MWEAAEGSLVQFWNGREEVEFHFANYANLISMMSQRQKINLYKIPSRSYIFELISGLFA